MFEIENDLKYLRQRKILGTIPNSHKTASGANLLKIEKEIEKTRKLRNTIIKLFENDVIKAVKDIDLKYLNNVPYPILIDYRNLFKNNYLVLKIFTINCIYENCLISKEKIVSSDIKNVEIERIYAEINTYIKRLFNVVKETNLLDNTFYDKLEVLLYKQYIRKLIISGDGIKLPLDDIYNLGEYEKSKILRFYYNNLKRILKNIQIEDVIELEKYRSNIDKQKVLEIYRG